MAFIANVEIRPEEPTDRPAVRRVNSLAFGRPDEADLVEVLRGAARPLVSLVAVTDGQVVGHILFSPVSLATATLQPAAMALGPLAVLPSHQRAGIGGRLIEVGLAACDQMGCPAVFVLGHSGYYPRFGFRPTAPLGLHWEHEAPAEAFMVAILKDGSLDGVRGAVRFHPAFDGV